MNRGFRTLAQQADQNRSVGALDTAAAENDRGIRCQWVVREYMWNKLYGRERPKLRVPLRQQGRVGAPEGGPLAAAHNFPCQSASVVQPVNEVEVEVDPGHSAARGARFFGRGLLTFALVGAGFASAFARSIRNRVSMGTGRPVDPLAAPDFQAVPAMSR
jgi:hypothetical protein